MYRGKGVQAGGALAYKGRDTRGDRSGVARTFPTRSERTRLRQGEGAAVRHRGVGETLDWLIRRSLSSSPGDERLALAFRNEERAGFMLAALVRIAIMAATALTVALTSRYNGITWVMSVAWPLHFVLIGIVQFELARRRINPPWLKYAWVTFDCSLMTFFIVGGNPFVTGGPPPSTILRESVILYYFVFLIQAAFTFSPRLVAWTGICIIAGWSLVLFYVVMQPGVFFDLGLPDEAGLRSYARRYANPFYFPLSKWLLEVFAVFFLTAALAIAVSRSRRLVGQATTAERARSNLARHFSPNLVDTLSISDKPFDTVRRQNAAVLFADIRGFTTYAEAADPDEVIELLRAFHARLEHEVFERQGTLDKIMGDGLMASFGVPAPDPRDAVRALACARAMLDSLERWNAERAELGLDAIRVGIGLHYGPVVAGNVGSERRLAFEVIGDTVNTASRLQATSKDLGVRLVVSAALIEKARAEDADETARLSRDLRAEGAISIRGREMLIEVLTLP